MMWLKKPQVHVYTCIGYFPVPGYTGQAIGGAMKNMPMKTGECPKAAGKSETMLPLICRREIWPVISLKYYRYGKVRSPNFGRVPNSGQVYVLELFTSVGDWRVAQLPGKNKNFNLGCQPFWHNLRTVFKTTFATAGHSLRISIPLCLVLTDNMSLTMLRGKLSTKRGSLWVVLSRSSSSRSSANTQALPLRRPGEGRRAINGSVLGSTRRNQPNWLNYISESYF